MKRFKTKRQSGNWFRSVNTSVADLNLANPEFPWEQLREHTDAYLNKKKGNLTQDEIEGRLVALMQQHSSKDVAIAACGHRLSPETLRALLTRDVNIDPGNVNAFRAYLQAIIAANRVNPSAVSNIEAQRARELMAVNEITASPGQYLSGLMKILLAGVPPTFLVYPHFDALGRRASRDFALQLETLRLEGQWLRAYKASSWLSSITDRSIELSPENLGPEQLLDSAFPSWKVWAAWRPDVERLRRWNDLSAQNNVALRDILALEGPDFFTRGATLKERTMARSFGPSTSTVRLGNVQFVLSRGQPNEVQTMLDNLFQAVDTASRAGLNETQLLAHFCVGKPITHESLDILATIHSIGDPSISAALIQIYGVRGDSQRVRMIGVMKLLPFLNDRRAQKLRDSLIPDLVDLISTSVEEMQSKLQNQLTAGRPWSGLEQNLQAFGNALQEFFWLRPLLDMPLQVLLNDWPQSEEIQILQDLRISAQDATPGIASSLTKKIDLYCTDKLITRGVLDDATGQLIRALTSLWMKGPDDDLRSVALIVAQGGFGTQVRCRCLALLPMLPPGFIYSVRLVLQNWENGAADAACIDLARLLASMPASEGTNYWRRVLYQMLVKRDGQLIEHALSTLKADDWIQLIGDVHAVCGNEAAPGGDRVLADDNLPAVLDFNFLAWAQYLSIHSTAVAHLENDLHGSGLLPRCILVGGDELLKPSLEHILDLLTMYYGGQYQEPMLAMIRLLAPDGKNAEEACKVLSLLIATTKTGIETCMRVLDLHEDPASSQVAAAMLAIWLHDPELDSADKRTLNALAEMLNLSSDLNDSNELREESIAAAADYLDAQFAKLFAEAQRLEGLRAVFQSVDSAGISEMMATLNIECPTPVEDELAKLPPALVGLVEKVSEREVELQVPLSQLRPLQRIAMGVGNAQSVIVRLDLGDYKIPAGFCIHFDDKSTNHDTHHPWEIARNDRLPEGPICHGRQNRTGYQLARNLTRHLQSGFKSIEDIHTVVTATLKDTPQSCLVCGAAHSISLRRSAVCPLPRCSTIFFRASLEIRLAEIRHDPQVVDLLLTMAFHAASTGNIALLPNCPFPTTQIVLPLLQGMPPMSKLSTAADLTVAIQRLGAPSEQLLSWICLSYRGFLTSATGTSKVPNMPPGTHQFLLASATPEKESAHTGQMGGLPSRVLWHGTALGRLFSITNQGLQVMSGTALQAHGASAGNGVYTAEEPSTSWAYSNPQYGYGGGAGVPSWPGSTLGNTCALLGLEAAGPSIIGGYAGVQVVPNAATLMVRYIFLIPSSVRVVPAAANIAPAMLSVYNSLRAGAL